LRDYVKTALVATGVPGGDAETVAEIMIEIDLLGGGGHGLFRLPQYARRIRAGGINPAPDIHVVAESDSTAVVDGDDCLGHLAVKRAADIAMDKAEKTGIGWAGVRNGNHAGTANVYVRMPLARDMIGIYSAVGSANHVPPWGGIAMLLSTNPIAVAVPALEEPPVVLDMATTVAAYGKVKTAAQRGETMPEGWMMGFDGKPLTDPNRSDEGFLLPVGGYKGYGLALILGLLAGTLNGAAFGSDVVDFNADDTTLTNTGQFICAISLKAFGDVDAFKRQVDVVSREMKASPTLPGFDRVRIPGEGSYAKYQDFSANGIPVHKALLENLADFAEDFGLAPLE